MKLSDYIAQFLVEKNVDTAFVFQGGASAHLIDSVGKNKDISYVCPQHEEHVAMAADGYSRVTGNIGVGIVTSGPGATNTLTGICSSYFDSIPVLLITGQVASFRVRETTKLRQYGFQETDVISVFSSVTKYAKQLKKPEDIRLLLEEALYHAKEGRPGPVLIDIPDDFQRAEINPDTLEKFTPPASVNIDNKDELIQLKRLIEEAKKPLFVFGTGVNIAHAKEIVNQLAEKLQIPFLMTWGAKDLFADENPLNFGGFGTSGPRYGNIAIQNADLVIGLGAKFSQLHTGGKLNEFAKNAKKVLVDIDIEEIKKFDNKDLQFDLTLNDEIKNVCSALLEMQMQQNDYSKWYSELKNWKNLYPICPKQLYDEKNVINPYVFIDVLSDALDEDAIIVADTGANLTWTMQAIKIKKNQKLFSAWNHTPMGYSLAGAIGAAIAEPNRQIICLIGDGGLQMCIEELATVYRNKLNIKIFLFNNHGHGIIRQTVNTWLDGNYNALDESSGLGFPDFNKVAEAYHLETATLSKHENIKENIQNILKKDTALFCNVEIYPLQDIRPQLVFGKSIDVMWPYLEDGE